jgi:uncharacterized protein YrrD
MRLSELRGKPVVSIAEARRVGIVDDALVDPSFRRLTALRIRSEGHGPGVLVEIGNVRGIGPDAVTITAREALMLPERASQAAGDPPLREAINSRLVTERGEAIGRLREIDFDPVTRLVRTLVYVSGMIDTILDRAHAVEIADVLGVGPGVVTIRATATSLPVGKTTGRSANVRANLTASGSGLRPESERPGGAFDEAANSPVGGGEEGGRLR